MQEQILLHNSTPEQLTESIIKGVKSILDEVTRPQSETKFITREQVCNLLSINLSTLWSYTKKGKLKSYGIGARVYYKLDEVEAAIKPLKA
jgi:predicted DNA-binding transcriptional regulator AlpA